MKRLIIIAAVLAASRVSAPAQSIDSGPVVSACLTDYGDVTPTQINCLRTALAKAEREMNSFSIAACSYSCGVPATTRFRPETVGAIDAS